jgi:hypothetical protein
VSRRMLSRGSCDVVVRRPSLRGNQLRAELTREADKSSELDWFECQFSSCMSRNGGSNCDPSMTAIFGWFEPWGGAIRPPFLIQTAGI